MYVWHYNSWGNIVTFATIKYKVIQSIVRVHVCSAYRVVRTYGTVHGRLNIIIRYPILFSPVIHTIFLVLCIWIVGILSTILSYVRRSIYARGFCMHTQESSHLNREEKKNWIKKKHKKSYVTNWVLIAPNDCRQIFLKYE